MDILNAVTLPAADPTADNQAVRRAWIEEQFGWGLADYNASGAGIKAWAGSPGNCTSGALTFGRIQLNKVWLRAAATLSTVHLNIAVAGAGLTSSQNFVALYDSSGNQVAISADQTTAWGTTGIKDTALVTPYAAAAGGYYVAVLSNGSTTAPSLTAHRTSGSAMINYGLTLATARTLQTGTGNTSMPSSITLGSQNFSSLLFEAILT